MEILPPWRFAMTIEGDDGLPADNEHWYVSGYEVLAVILGYRKCSITCFDENWDSSEPLYHRTADGKSEPCPLPSILYTYEDLKNMAKDTRLVKYEEIYFKYENIQYAYTLWRLRNKKVLIDDYEVLHTMIGILLSYEKRDICAWFGRGTLEHEYSVDFEDKSQREDILKNSELVTEYRVIKEWFEEIWEEATIRLSKLMMDEVPEEWKKDIVSVFS